VHLERTKEYGKVVGTQGWKRITPEEIEVPVPMTTNNKKAEKEKSIHDDIWDHFWGDNNKATSACTTTTTTTDSSTSNTQQPCLVESSNFRPPVLADMAPRTPTPELPKHDPLIPKSHAVTPGQTADIVLKQDQGSGRTVRGVIAEVLTRGDHPWGIKVRLSDGRVGRVQRILHT
jgi:uncharacterized repeat protein (TIGR03833 family)